MKHIIVAVAREEGRFLGWPANDGVWSCSVMRDAKLYAFQFGD